MPSGTGRLENLDVVFLSLAQLESDVYVHEQQCSAVTCDNCWPRGGVLLNPAVLPDDKRICPISRLQRET